MRWAFQKNPDGTYKTGFDNLTVAEAAKLLLVAAEIERERDKK